MTALQADSLLPPPGTPLYVHLPFCVVKCTYCDFYSVLADGHDRGAFVDALLAEARERAPRAPRTVFFGGGTPSFLSEQELVRVFEGLEECTGFRGSAEEVTVECNPESLTLSKARLLRALGADRLSIGFQSLEPEILALFGRAHTAEKAFEAYDAARAAGFERVSVDLIYSVPGQRLERFEADLERVLALAPEHVSAYSLAFEEGTSFTRWLAEGRLQPLDEELELAFFERTRGRLEAAGYTPYEISNFAPDGEQCRHNVNYWRNGTYVGLGPSAVSKLGSTRFGNPRSLVQWQREVGERGRAGAWEETLAPLGRLGETWWLGLRLREGVEAADAWARSGLETERATGKGAALLDSADPGLALARDLAAQGWLEEHLAGAWRLAPRALAVADAVSARFLSLDHASNAGPRALSSTPSNPRGLFLPAG